MQPDEKQIDQVMSEPAGDNPEINSLPLPILLRIPWFPQDATAPPLSGTAPAEVMPAAEVLEAVPVAHSLPRPAAPKAGRFRQRVAPVAAGCLSALIAAAVLDGFWGPKPGGAGPHPVTELEAVSPFPSISADPEPSLAPPLDPAPSLDVANAVRVSLLPEIIPLDPGEEP